MRGHVSTLLSLGAGFNRELSGRENILLNAAFLGIPRKEIGRRMEAITEFADRELDLVVDFAGFGSTTADAIEAVRPFGPSAVTDVTGFGLLGHAHETASRSGVRIVLDAAGLPAMPGALEVARAGERTGGDRRNREFAGAHVEVSGDVPDEVLALAWDPQTSGGLLVSLPAERGAVLQASFDA